MDVKLTKDGDALICLMYKKYCEERKHGKSIEESAYMGDDIDIQRNLVPKWLVDDVSLSDDGICYMRDRFPKGISEIIDALSILSGLVVPWL